MGNLKKLWTACWLALACWLCVGCSSVEFRLAAPEELYSLPSLPAEYTELNNCIRSLLEQGAEYAAPVSGANTQAVQLVDRDGDGRE